MKFSIIVKKFYPKAFKEKLTKIEEANSFKDANSESLSSNFNQYHSENESEVNCLNSQNTSFCSHCRRPYTINTSDHGDFSIKKCSNHDPCESLSENEMKPTPILKSSRSENAIHLHFNNEQPFKSVKNIYKKPILSQSSTSLFNFDVDKNNNMNFNFADCSSDSQSHPNHQHDEGNYYDHEYKRKRRSSTYIPSSNYPSLCPYLNSHPLPLLPISTFQQVQNQLKKKVSFSDPLCEMNQYSTTSSLSSTSALSHHHDYMPRNSSHNRKPDVPNQYPIQNNSHFYNHPYDHQYYNDHQYHNDQQQHDHSFNYSQYHSNYNKNNNDESIYSKSVPSSLPFYLIINKPNEYIPKSVDMNAKKVSKYLSTKKFRDKKQWNDDEEQNKMNQVYNHHQHSDRVPFNTSNIDQCFNYYKDKGKGKLNYDCLYLQR